MSGVSSAVSGAIIEFANPVQNIGALRAIAAAHRVDKQARLVEDKGAIYYFNAQGVGADDGDGIIKPDDVAPADPGRWFKMQGSLQDHQSLLNLQGGVSAERHHLTQATATKAANSIAATVFTNTVQLEASAANYEDVTHNLGNQFPLITVMINPPSGVYQDTWINGEGSITIKYLSVSTVRVYNESGVAFAAGRVKIAVGG